MKKTNIATLRTQMRSLLNFVQKGNEIQIEKRNIPVAKIIPIKTSTKNKTQLGIGKGSVKFLKDVIDPVFEKDWEMNQ